jgi:hypothetical protein
MRVLGHMRVLGRMRVMGGMHFRGRTCVLGCMNAMGRMRVIGRLRYWAHALGRACAVKRMRWRGVRYEAQALGGRIGQNQLSTRAQR